MATPKTILLKGDGLYKEAAAGAAVTPGYLLARNASGQFIPHSLAGQNAIPLFAKENDVVGGDIDTSYATGDNVIAVMPERGGEVYAKVAAGAAAIAIGDYLESAGDGTLRKHTPQAVDEGGTGTYSIYTNAIVARAIEAVDNSGGTAEARIKVETV